MWCEFSFFLTCLNSYFTHSLTTDATQPLTSLSSPYSKRKPHATISPLRLCPSSLTTPRALSPPRRGLELPFRPSCRTISSRSHSIARAGSSVAFVHSHPPSSFNTPHPPPPPNPHLSPHFNPVHVEGRSEMGGSPAFPPCSLYLRRIFVELKNRNCSKPNFFVSSLSIITIIRLPREKREKKRRRNTSIFFSLWT